MQGQLLHNMWSLALFRALKAHPTKGTQLVQKSFKISGYNLRNYKTNIHIISNKYACTYKVTPNFRMLQICLFSKNIHFLFDKEPGSKLESPFLQMRFDLTQFYLVSAVFDTYSKLTQQYYRSANRFQTQVLLANCVL